jgi:hypothetical protein
MSRLFAHRCVRSPGSAEPAEFSSIRCITGCKQWISHHADRTTSAYLANTANRFVSVQIIQNLSPHGACGHRTAFPRRILGASNIIDTTVTVMHGFFCSFCAELPVDEFQPRKSVVQLAHRVRLAQRCAEQQLRCGPSGLPSADVGSFVKCERHTSQFRISVFFPRTWLKY